MPTVEQEVQVLLRTEPGIRRAKLVLAAIEIVVGIGVGAATAAFNIAISSSAVMPGGSWQVVGIELVALVAVAASVVAFLAPFFLISDGARVIAIGALVGSVSALCLTIAGVNVGSRIRMAALADLADRMQPVVEAMNSYWADHQAAPDTLEELVPAYLPRLPEHIPKFYVLKGRFAPDGNQWGLSSSITISFLGCDDFVYYQNRNYPLRFGVKGVGRWAYVEDD